MTRCTRWVHGSLWKKSCQFWLSEPNLSDAFCLIAFLQVYSYHLLGLLILLFLSSRKTWIIYWKAAQLVTCLCVCARGKDIKIEARDRSRNETRHLRILIDMEACVIFNCGKKCFGNLNYRLQGWRSGCQCPLPLPLSSVCWGKTCIMKTPSEQRFPTLTLP